jgi:hypothetical protein
VSTYAHRTMFTDLYEIEYSDYWPTSNERLEDRAEVQYSSSFSSESPTERQEGILSPSQKHL